MNIDKIIIQHYDVMKEYTHDNMYTLHDDICADCVGDRSHLPHELLYEFAQNVIQCYKPGTKEEM